MYLLNKPVIAVIYIRMYVYLYPNIDCPLYTLAK